MIRNIEFAIMANSLLIDAYWHFIEGDKDYSEEYRKLISFDYPRISELMLSYASELEFLMWLDEKYDEQDINLINSANEDLKACYYEMLKSEVK